MFGSDTSVMLEVHLNIRTIIQTVFNFSFVVFGLMLNVSNFKVFLFLAIIQYLLLAKMKTLQFTGSN